MSPEQYLLESLKRHLSTTYPTYFNFTLLPFGAHAAARRAEMAHDRTAEYLGEKLSGGAVESIMSSISSRQAEVARSRAAGSVVRATETATETATEMARKKVGESLAKRRAEEMDASGFVQGAVMWVSWPVVLLVKWTWDLMVSLWTLLTWLYTTTTVALSWTPWLLVRGALIGLAVYGLFFIVQGLAFQPAFPTVQRWVWYEDFDPEYELPWGVLGWVVGRVFAIVIFPLKVLWVVGRVLWALVEGSENCRAVRKGLRKAGRSLRETGHALWMDLWYNVFVDRLQRWHWNGTAWLARNFVRVSAVCLALALGLGYLSRLTTFHNEPEILHFDSVEEMGAHFGIPKSFFVVSREQGSSSHYRPEEWVALRDGDGVDVAEERMAMDWEVPRRELEEFERMWEEVSVGEVDGGVESAVNAVEIEEVETGDLEDVEAGREGMREDGMAEATDEGAESVSSVPEKGTPVATIFEDAEEEPEGQEEEAVDEVADEVAESVQSVPEIETPPPRAPKRRKGAEHVWKGEGWVGYCRKCRQRHCCEAAEADETDFLDFESEDIVW